MSMGKPSPDSQIQKLKTLRWKARTDLMFLLQIILGEQFHLTEATHRPVINMFQQFPEPSKEQFYENDKCENGEWKYKPIKTLDELCVGNKKVLVLDSRGFAKSTINLLGHSIQWIINYPDIAMLLMQANLQKIQAVVKEIKSVFQYNEVFRQLFPEHCPRGKVSDWGKMTEFTTEGRKDMRRREPSVLGLSLGTGVAGLHFHVMKFSDIVEQNNSETPEQIQKVVAGYDMCKNLLDRPDYWTDVEGTRYNLADLYGKIIESEIEWRKQGKDGEYRIFSRGCYRKDVSSLGYTEPRYTPEELDCPDVHNARGLPVSNWPEKFSAEKLEQERTNKISPDAELTFNCQRRNNPLDPNDRTRAFPYDGFRVISPQNYKNVPIAYRQVTIDTATTQKIRSNYSVLTVGAWSANGKLYIEDIIHGKFLPEEIVFHMFALHRRYEETQKPRMYFIEKTMYVDGLMPTINRVQDTGNLWVPEGLREKYGKRDLKIGNVRLPITLMPRETNLHKQDRIRLTLQAPYSTGDLVFLEDIDCLEYAKQEFFKFPQFHTDDIIDTVADHFAQKEYFGRLKPRPTVHQEMNNAWDRLLGIESPWSPFAGTHNIPTPFNPYDRTGGL